MKKVALIFALAVILPSLVLAWLAVRSLRDQQFLLEHQQALIDQRATDALVQNISDYLTQQQQAFDSEVEKLAAGKAPHEAAVQFDRQLREHWPLAEVGFCVTLSGKILSPSPVARPEAQKFYENNKDFLGNRQTAEIYLSQNQNFANANSPSYSRGSAGQFSLDSFSSSANDRRELQSRQATLALAPPAAQSPEPAQFGRIARQSTQVEKKPGQSTTANRALVELSDATTVQQNLSTVAVNGAVSGHVPQQKTFQQALRKISPQNAPYSVLKTAAGESRKNLSKVVPAQAEFAQLIGNQTDGMLARFLQNKLKLMFWHRLKRNPDLIFGAELNLDRVVDDLRQLVQPDPALQNEICLAILDDNARPVALSRKDFSANWKHPFVATEIGDALPHWEVAAYLVNPAALTQAARTAELTLGLLVTVLVLAIGIGSWLIVSSLNAELKLARQKTDFVSNVSHELKTPLTSIRMFSELLAEDRVADAVKQRSYLQIITAEAARLTRLINNVLDFSRMERGQKKYNFQTCDLTDLIQSTTETIRPHLEANGFKFVCELLSSPISVRGDADALSQIIMNLLSNAEKYSAQTDFGGVVAERRNSPEGNSENQSVALSRDAAAPRKEITVQLAQKQSPLSHAEIKVLDRGTGVPPGSEGKIFEKFYRAHDLLSSGVQGSGLGLTIARQIARAHGGDVSYEPRDGGGSCFILRLPITGRSQREEAQIQ